MDSQAASQLAQVPVEILLRITSFLTTPELSSVRLTCKRVEESLFAFFSHEFFRKKQFMLYGPSLQALLDISSHPTLSPYLKHVIIATDSFNMRGPFHDAGEDTSVKFRVAAADQWSLINTGHDRVMLAKALGNLANLETVDIRDFNGRLRTRDGPRACWTSYGGTTARIDTDQRVTMYNPDRLDYVGHIFSVILASLADSGAHPSNLEVVIRDLRWGVDDGCFHIPPWLEPSLAPVLSNLRKLHLCVNLSQGLGVNPPGKTRGFFLQKFLTFTPNITWLRINFQHSPDNLVYEFLSWLSLPAPEEATSTGTLETPDPVALLALEQLDFGNAKIHSSTLMALLPKFAATLQGLAFVRVTLVDARPPVRARVNMWAKFFRWLAAKGKQNLRKIYVRQPWQKYSSSTEVATERCFFKDSQGREGQDERQYSGSYIGEFLEDIAKEIDVYWQTPLELDDESMDDVDEEEEEEEEEEEDQHDGTNTLPPRPITRRGGFIGALLHGIRANCIADLESNDDEE